MNGTLLRRPRVAPALFTGLLVALAACSTRSGVSFVEQDVLSDASDAAPDVTPADAPMPDVTPLDAPAPDAAQPVDAPAEAVVDAPVDAPVDTGCPGGRRLCVGVCVDTMTDDGNCGACSNTCTATQSCLGGACVPNCVTPQARCGAACVDRQTDARHCGACENACAAGEACVAGACVVACAADQRRCAGACVNTQSDGSHCGACGVACAAAQMCAMGACVTTCAATQTRCGAGAGRPGSCADLAADTANCGACGNACASGQSCARGACVCPAGQTVCGGRCVSTRTDSLHCGACGAVCSGGLVCRSGACRAPGPSNDDCESPAVLDFSAAALTVAGTTTNAINSANSCAGAADVFYQFTLTRREVVYVDTFGTGWNTYVGLQRPGCGESATSCSDDACGTLQTQFTETLDAGTYLIVVDQFNATGGDFNLHVQHAPVGNGPVGALDLSVGTRRLTGTTAGAGAVTSACCSDGPEDMYVATTCPSFAEVGFRASTCDLASFDTELDFRSGNRVAAGGSLCDSDTCGQQSVVAGRVPGGAGLHVLYVDGCAGGRGAYGVDLVIGDCAAGQTRCGAACVDLASDRSHCGACGNVCSTPACVGGVCATPAGSVTFSAPGAASFVVPAGVTEVSVVVVGGGGAGVAGTSNSGGGGGGGLCYVNSYAVTPGATIPVVVGAGGAATASGGSSSFGGSLVAYGGAGTASAPGGAGGRGTGGTCFAGGNGGSFVGGGAPYHAGGGGAAGYAGNGGGGSWASGSSCQNNATSGAGGGGGGGGGGSDPSNCGAGYGGGGGGVGLTGLGSNGFAGASSCSCGGVGAGGAGGSGGVAGVVGSSGNGGNYGGGGGSGPGGGGAVRVIWGTGRSFPSAAP